MNTPGYPEHHPPHTGLQSSDYDLTVRQNPERARVAGGKEKERKPVDPPPIIQLRVRDESDPSHNYLQSPYYFMCCGLHHPTEDRPAPVPASTALAGTLVSSLHRLKDIDNSDGGFFVFGDLSVRVEGEFRLKFNLFEMRKDEVVHIKSILSKPFQVLPPKNFPGMTESTFLSRSFADQGIKLRIRKEPRALLKRPMPRPEEYPTPLPPRYPERPSSGYPEWPTSSVQSAPPMNAYAQPDREYASYYAPAPKRQRNSVDLGARTFYGPDMTRGVGRGVVYDT
ncbi:Spore development regulator ryp2 [Coccidioides posadasii str. Silveira]|uniref:Uncharacterized protein n=3 Tax=Coccidioides posadasii TaxID=199306 RepID=E9CW09_COCPS|nr:VosA, putative [Coccidioides posadasii C735 delta SOWgp]EER23554.1 VosA, putative [Coccidioides posadasii C735 delta SOWgp]EFW21485.1 conserved hypothetical protein [Coccidioides posadasii str. Silveira]KMM64961.1 hypothetical protein CPAG_01313 [Coccidioides posadasii RMSCC 3488]QVM06972.1 Spore development regulator ryp2 [Coccidioides posadasii str. Silveira]|eukprot:XP_003065699.1 VosA, putative [Coccidioides posadasii C735 delta SOWgp]